MIAAIDANQCAQDSAYRPALKHPLNLFTVSYSMKKKIAILTITLTLGLVCGFKWANYNYRRDQAVATINEATKAVAGLNQPGSNNNANAAGSNQGQQMFNQVTAIINKARENPKDLEAQKEAAKQFLQIKRPEGALEFLNKAIALKPDDVETMTQLAQAHFFAEQFNDSIKWSRAALKKQPDSEAAAYYLTTALIVSKQNLGEAEQLISRLEGKRGAADPLLSELKQMLREAQAGNANQGQPQSKTMLQHGPDASNGAGVKK